MGGLVVAAAGMAVPAVSMHPAAVVAGVAFAAAGTGAMFVVASATALGQVAPHEAGIASGIVSTFHEFGASIGAAAVSSVAAASLVGDTLTGFADGFVARRGRRRGRGRCRRPPHTRQARCGGGLITSPSSGGI